jgi:choline dehydrogenase-like flavoprotein
VKPYYDKIDKLIGVFGSKENIPNEPDGYFLPPPKPRLHELYIKKGANKAGVPMIPSRLSILTKPVNKKRGACFFCSQCSRSCMAYADFSSSSVLVKPAMETGNVDLYVNAMVREVLTNGEGEVTGVSYINKEDLKDYELKAKVVILAASACSSARLLLNSKSAQHPNGLANSSGVVGKYLHDSTGSSRGGFIPDLVDRERYNEDGVGGMHLYTPWWLNDNKNLGFTRGYHIEYWGGMSMPAYGFGFNTQALKEITGDTSRNAYGTGLKKDVKKFYGATFGMAGRGESIPRKENYCEIDPNTIDKFGIPVLKFNYSWSDEEVKQAKHMQDTFEEVIHNMGAVPLGDKPGKETNYGLENPGRIIHEVGTTRMGEDSRYSVVNEFNQAHDVPNLFVMDGGPFVSQADKNPTWTILALAWRATDFLIEELKKGNI